MRRCTGYRSNPITASVNQNAVPAPTTPAARHIAVDKRAVACCPELSKSVRFYTPFSDENARVIGQNGLFSFSETGEELESLIAHTFQGQRTPVLRKMYLPNTERVQVLRGLEQMNINHLTLFPDLSGACNYANMQFELSSH